MSMSAQVNSYKEVTRGASGEDLTRNAPQKEHARVDSREKPARNGSPGKTDRCDSLDIRTRCDELRRLSEDELLSGMETAHGTERAALLEVLLYLIEFERRRFYLARGFGSLFDFCMETYRYSRSAAWRRISAARCLARFPRIGGMLITGELTLSVISMISGIMTPENAGDVLRRVRGKSFRDAELLVARHRPERVLRDRIKPVFVMSPDAARGAPVRNPFPVLTGFLQGASMRPQGKIMRTPVPTSEPNAR